MAGAAAPAPPRQRRPLPLPCTKRRARRLAHMPSALLYNTSSQAGDVLGGMVDLRHLQQPAPGSAPGSGAAPSTLTGASISLLPPLTHPQPSELTLVGADSAAGGGRPAAPPPPPPPPASEAAATAASPLLVRPLAVATGRKRAWEEATGAAGAEVPEPGTAHSVSPAQGQPHALLTPTAASRALTTGASALLSPASPAAFSSPSGLQLGSPLDLQAASRPRTAPWSELVGAGAGT